MKQGAYKHTNGLCEQIYLYRSQLEYYASSNTIKKCPNLHDIAVTTYKIPILTIWKAYWNLMTISRTHRKWIWNKFKQINPKNHHEAWIMTHNLWLIPVWSKFSADLWPALTGSAGIRSLLQSMFSSSKSKSW